MTNQERLQRIKGACVLANPSIETEPGIIRDIVLTDVLFAVYRHWSDVYMKSGGDPDMKEYHDHMLENYFQKITSLWKLQYPKLSDQLDVCLEYIESVV